MTQVFEHLNTRSVHLIHTCVEAGKNDQRGLLWHLLVGLLREPSVTQRVRQEATDSVLEALHRFNGTHAAFGEEDLHIMLQSALGLARDSGAQQVTPTVLLASLLASSHQFGRENQRLIRAVEDSGLSLSQLVAPTHQDGTRDYSFAPLGFGRNLTAMARDGYWLSSPYKGDDAPLVNLARILSAETESVIVVGPPGVGKTALMNGLVWTVTRGSSHMVTEDLTAMTFVSISPGTLVGGTGNRGELEERLENMISFFRKNRSVVPFFDEVHRILSTEDSTGRVVGDVLKPAISEGTFRFIGATTDTEYDRYIARDVALSSRVTRVMVSEPSPQITKEILTEGIDDILEAHGLTWGLSLVESAIDESIRLTEAYQQQQRQPRKSHRLLKQTVSDVVFDLQRSISRSRVIDDASVRVTFADRSGIPEPELAGKGDTAFRNHLEERLKAKVKGQDHAIGATVNILQLHRWGWTMEDRPRGRFLFLGPPGVGKTELAKAIAREVLFDPEAIVVRNMGEYAESTSKSRWLGPDPGYVGYGDIETVYSAVASRSHAVILLDEFEKAHPSLANVLLSMFDGEGADSRGRVVDFSHCIFILTSNAIEEDEVSGEQLRAALRELGSPRKTLGEPSFEIFTPPLIDRLDEIIMFKPLTKVFLREILKLKIERIQASARIPLPQEIWTHEVQENLVHRAMEGRAGSARGLERSLKTYLGTFVGQNRNKVGNR